MKTRIFYHRYVSLPWALGSLQLKRAWRLAAIRGIRPVLLTVGVTGLASMGYFGGSIYADASNQEMVAEASPSPNAVAVASPTPTATPTSTPAPSATPVAATPATPVPAVTPRPAARLTAAAGTGSTYVNRYYVGYCTWYVANRRQVPPLWGNAVSWYNSAQAAGWSVGPAPAVGAIAWTIGGNHVSYVEQVSGSQVYVSEMNYNGNFNRVTYRWAPASSFRYIY